MTSEIAALSRDVAALLKARGQTLAVAESCTGGRLAAAFTAEAGASEYFLGGVVAYSNDVKASVLGVSRETLSRFGAVSGETAREMALGVRRLTGADWTLSTTGIAGPGGGTAEKPVGTLWLAVAGPEGAVAAETGAIASCSETAVVVRGVRLGGVGRDENINLATATAIKLLCEAAGWQRPRRVASPRSRMFCECVWPKTTFSGKNELHPKSWTKLLGCFYGNTAIISQATFVGI